MTSGAAARPVTAHAAHSRPGARPARLRRSATSAVAAPSAMPAPQPCSARSMPIWPTVRAVLPSRSAIPTIPSPAISTGQARNRRTARAPSGTAITMAVSARPATRSSSVSVPALANCGGIASAIASGSCSSASGTTTATIPTAATSAAADRSLRVRAAPGSAGASRGRPCLTAACAPRGRGTTISGRTGSRRRSVVTVSPRHITQCNSCSVAVSPRARKVNRRASPRSLYQPEITLGVSRLPCRGGLLDGGLIGGYLGHDPPRQPDAGDPQRAEDASEPVHHGDERTRGDDRCLEHGASDERPAHAWTADHAAEHQPGNRQASPESPGRTAVQVLELDGRHDGEQEDDRLHDEDRAAEPPQQLLVCHDSSAEVKECRDGCADGVSAAGMPPSGASRMRASPAVITEPVMRTPPSPGRPASSARPTAMSIASSSRSATRTLYSPKISPAISASSSGSMDLASEEYLVTTISLSSGSSSARMPATSLSLLTATTPVSRVKLNSSCIAATVTAMPPGLCAASMITVGLRRSTSSLPGDRTLPNPSRTRSVSRAAPSPSETPANASTAASAHAALLA